MIKLVITEEQMKKMLTALDVTARARMGQLEPLLSLIPKKDGSAALTLSDIENIENKVKSKMNLTKNSFYGVGKDKLVDTLFYIHNKIQHLCSWKEAKDNGLTNGLHRNMSEMIYVNYDEPIDFSNSIKDESVKVMTEGVMLIVGNNIWIYDYLKNDLEKLGVTFGKKFYCSGALIDRNQLALALRNAKLAKTRFVHEKLGEIDNFSFLDLYEKVFPVSSSGKKVSKKDFIDIFAKNKPYV